MLYRQRICVDKYFEPGGENLPFSLTRPLNDMVTSPKYQTPCLICQTSRKYTFFPEVNEGPLTFPEDNCDPKRAARKGTPRSAICIYCLNAIADYVAQKNNDDKVRAIGYVCALTNTYFDVDVARLVLEDEDRTLARESIPKGPMSPKIHWMDAYFRHLSYEKFAKDKDFINSEDLNLTAIMQEQRNQKGLMSDYSFEVEKAKEKTKIEEQKEAAVVATMTEEDQKNRSQVIINFHRDPFANESPEDRPQMYQDALTMMTPDISENLPKARAVIEIVKAYSRIDKINKALVKLQNSAESMLDNEKSIKLLVEQKDKEMKGIAALCKDNGLSDKYAGSNTKGVGTITSVVRQMNESSYDPGRLNKFDIETTEAMQQVADVSLKAIFKQLGLNGADFSAIVKDQAKTIRELQNTLEAQSEELRLLKCQYIKQDLLDEYEQILKERGIAPAEIEKIMKQQIQYKPYDDSSPYYNDEGNESEEAEEDQSEDTA